MTYRIAVIGSGMAGLTAAYGCTKRGHEVTVFESEKDFGMAAHTLEFEQGVIDVPLRVMSPDAWPNATALAKEVGVDFFAIKTFTSCSWLNQSTWFRSGELPLLNQPFVGSWRYLDFNAIQIGLGLRQLVQLTRQLEQEKTNLTLEEVLEKQSFSPKFWRGLMLPILTTICTCDEKHLLAWPALQLLQLLDSIMRNDSLCRIKGGSTALVKALSEGVTLHAESPVTRVTYCDDKVQVENERGEGGLYDRVIVATQANHLHFLDPEAFAEELEILQAIRFDSGVLWVHQDQRFMPEQRSDWTALNFQMDARLLKPMFTVWVNAVEPSLVNASPVFQTWNPLYNPEPKTVLAQIPLQRAVVHAGTEQAQIKLQQLHQQPDRRVFFCGSWAHEGVPLLESAVSSAHAVVALCR
ncbi:FAD-dependent oxidoreductase [Nitrincola sp. A-D6]|uniref:FAD-dependent oxidoreductase n=1 Tax=Nitrincola sp. A-D6 TaxID=1545442 RepID=UPI00068C52D9|nr:FAD-dependent oxidoreductase [Nitrincola sp. A-D6]